MSVDIAVEPTAHPRARKFVLTTDVRIGAPVTFRSAAECRHVPLAVALLETEGVGETHFAENFITVTATRTADWSVLETKIIETIVRLVTGGHDPRMPMPRMAPADQGEALAVINRILDETARPYLQSHGGELDLLGYDPETCRLLVAYVGTCGACPASSSGTLDMIQAILKEEFDPRIQVEIAGEY